MRCLHVVSLSCVSRYVFGTTKKGVNNNNIDNSTANNHIDNATKNHITTTTTTNEVNLQLFNM